MRKNEAKKGISTRAIHAGHDNGGDPHKPLVTPIYQTASYEFDRVDDLWAFYQKKSDRLAEYARYGTPTQRALEETLMALEGAEDCAVTTSGMNAITSAICSVMNAGDHMVTLNEGYRGTFKMFDQHLARFGLKIIKDQLVALIVQVLIGDEYLAVGMSLVPQSRHFSA